VYELYGLTKDEIATVDAAFGNTQIGTPIP
jgi:hypothetical protein